MFCNDGKGRTHGDQESETLWSGMRRCLSGTTLSEEPAVVIEESLSANQR